MALKNQLFRNTFDQAIYQQFYTVLAGIKPELGTQNSGVLTVFSIDPKVASSGMNTIAARMHIQR